MHIAYLLSDSQSTAVSTGHSPPPLRTLSTHTSPPRTLSPFPPSPYAPSTRTPSPSPRSTDEPRGSMTGNQQLDIHCSLYLQFTLQLDASK